MLQTLPKNQQKQQREMYIDTMLQASPLPHINKRVATKNKKPKS